EVAIPCGGMAAWASAQARRPHSFPRQFVSTGNDSRETNCSPEALLGQGLGKDRFPTTRTPPPTTGTDQPGAGQPGGPGRGRADPGSARQAGPVLTAVVATITTTTKTFCR